MGLLTDTLEGDVSVLDIARKEFGMMRKEIATEIKEELPRANRMGL